MNISYKREMRHNYLILEAAGTEEENFEIRMLTENSIEGLLKFRVKQEEIGRYYCYEITSKQPLSRLLEFKEIKKEELIRLIAEIGAVLKRIEDYLLSESNLFLENIFILNRKPIRYGFVISRAMKKVFRMQWKSFYSIC